MTRRDDALERVLAAAHAVQEETRAVTASGSALAGLRDALLDLQRVDSPGESERDRRLREAALSVELGAPGAVDQLLGALADPVAALDWGGMAGDITLPETIIGRGGGCVLPVGEVAVLAGAGGQGKSRLSLQIALAAASTMEGHRARPFERVGASGLRPGALVPGAGDAIEVVGGPVVLLGWEDRAQWVRWRLREIAKWRAGGGVVDSDRLSFACVDRPLFQVSAGDRRDALPVATSTYAGLWKRVGEVGARVVIVDPAALALECPGFDPAPVGRFMSRLRADALDHGAGVLLVAHSTKAARGKAADDDDPGVVSGSASWWDRARCVLVLKREGDGVWRLRVAKSNYAKSDEPGEGVRLTDDGGGGRPVAFEDASAALPVNGSGSGLAVAPVDPGDRGWGTGTTA